MNFTLTQAEFKMFTECLDITIKEVGLKGLYTIVELVQLLENPNTKNEDTTLEYTFTEEQIQSFEMVLDITLKTLGISAAANVTGLMALLKNPNPEISESQVHIDEVVEAEFTEEA